MTRPDRHQEGDPLEGTARHTLARGGGLGEPWAVRGQGPGWAPGRAPKGHSEAPSAGRPGPPETSGHPAFRSVGFLSAVRVLREQTQRPPSPPHTDPSVCPPPRRVGDSDVREQLGALPGQVGRINYRCRVVRPRCSGSPAGKASSASLPTGLLWSPWLLLWCRGCGLGVKWIWFEPQHYLSLPLWLETRHLLNPSFLMYKIGVIMLVSRGNVRAQSGNVGGT